MIPFRGTCTRWEVKPDKPQKGSIGIMQKKMETTIMMLYRAPFCMRSSKTTVLTSSEATLHQDDRPYLP